MTVNDWSRYLDVERAATIQAPADTWEPPPEPPADEFSPDEAVDAFERAVRTLTTELLDTYALDGIPSLRPLVDGFLYFDSTARVIGASGHFKSFVVLDVAAHVGSGLPWRGHAVTQGPVIYLVAEGATGLRKRVRAWEQYHQRRMVGVRFLPRPVQAGDPVEWAVLTEGCCRIRPSLIIFDTQARITVGIEENSATEMGRFVQRIDALRTVTGACVLLVHHQGLKGEHGRGSTSVKAAQQTELTVRKEGPKGPAQRVIVHSDKQKDDEELDDVVFAVEVVKIDDETKADGSPLTSVVLVPSEPVSTQDPAKRAPAVLKIIAALEGAGRPLSQTEIGDRIAAEHGTGLRRETISKHLNDLAREGVAERTEDDHSNRAYWTLSPSSEAM